MALPPGCVFALCCSSASRAAYVLFIHVPGAFLGCISGRDEDGKLHGWAGVVSSPLVRREENAASYACPWYLFCHWFQHAASDVCTSVPAALYFVQYAVR